ncbi:hypothetical protein DSO57_1005085 [Entomophthora muscae]|uniref:Uncharacterized protein n=1 Tax=Entomophthora muscae TaxID=34485 RepID=A0ACC2RMS0_9FUNG|nr:hypothetical protein DSO57_1005085 [Entomophthora muscae]
MVAQKIVQSYDLRPTIVLQAQKRTSRLDQVQGRIEDEEEMGEVPVSEDLIKRLMIKAHAGEVPGPTGSGSWCQDSAGIEEHSRPKEGPEEEPEEPPRMTDNGTSSWIADVHIGKRSVSALQWEQVRVQLKLAHEDGFTAQRQLAQNFTAALVAQPFKWLGTGVNILDILISGKHAKAIYDPGCVGVTISKLFVWRNKLVTDKTVTVRIDNSSSLETWAQEQDSNPDPRFPWATSPMDQRAVCLHFPEVKPLQADIKNFVPNSKTSQTKEISAPNEGLIKVPNEGNKISTISFMSMKSTLVANQEQSPEGGTAPSQPHNHNSRAR